MSEAFNEYAEVYNFLYSDKDYIGEANYVHKLIQLHKKGAMEVLEYGSGTGIHGRLLGELNYKVKGIEPSDHMLSLAQESDNFSFQKGDIREYKDFGNEFEVCLVLFHVFNYLESVQDQRKAFENIRKQLSVGGLALLEVWHGPAVEFQKPEIRVKEVVGEFGTILRTARPLEVARHSVSIKYDIFFRPVSSHSYHRIQETHVLRPTYPEEINVLCQETDFRVLGTHAFNSDAPASKDTWSVIYILQAGK